MKEKGWRRGKMIFMLGFLLIFVPVLSFAQQYPTKPINLIVTFPPGGTLDISARILASKAEKFLGQPLVVSNVGGGAGSVALGQVAAHVGAGLRDGLVARTSEDDRRGRPGGGEGRVGGPGIGGAGTGHPHGKCRDVPRARQPGNGGERGPHVEVHVAPSVHVAERKDLAALSGSHRVADGVAGVAAGT